MMYDLGWFVRRSLQLHRRGSESVCRRVRVVVSSAIQDLLIFVYPTPREHNPVQ